MALGRETASGPLFFSVGLDEILTAVREAVRDLNVDSTMLGQVVHAVGSTNGRLDSGAHIPAIDDLPHIPATDDLPLTLVAAPTYAEIDALAEIHEERCGSRSVLGHLPIRRPTLPRYPRGLRAAILIVAYLDDIYCSYEAFLFGRISSGGEIVGWTRVQ